jgi:sulfide:quinone oxidoreductase
MGESAADSILVLGGGVGGLVVTSLLANRLGPEADIRLVERKKFFEFPPSYPWVMLGEREAKQVRRELAALKKKGIKVIVGEVSKIDTQRHSVEVDGKSLEYSKLVIALGADYAPAAIPGLRENSQHFYDLESALRLRKAVANFDGRTIAVGVSSLPFKCPAAPYEAALLLDHLLNDRRSRDRVKIQFFTPEGMPLPSAGPDVGMAALQFLESRGIESRFKVRLKEVRSGEAIFDDGSTMKFDLLFAVPPHRCPAVVQQAGLTDETGWIPVDSTTLRTKHDNVYAVGDVASISTPAGFVPYLPKAGVFAHGQAEVVANNIAFEIRGRGKRRVWDGSGSCFLMTGGAQAAFVKGSWFTTPRPDISFSPPSRVRYMQRVLFEKYWMHHWFD